MVNVLENTLRRVRDDQGGFLRDFDIAILMQHDRLRQLLVRCGACRFIAAAQDVDHIIGIIERDGADHIRDISLPCGDRAYSGDFRPVTNDPPRSTRKPLIEPLGDGSPSPAGWSTVGNSCQFEPSDADPGL